MLRTPIRRMLIFAALSALVLLACSRAARYVQRQVAGEIQFPKEAVRTVFNRLETEPSLIDSVLPGPRPTSSLSPPAQAAPCPSSPPWWPVGVACAQEGKEPVIRPTLPEDPTQALLDQALHTPELREAMLSRYARGDRTLQWKQAFIVGEGSDGLLAFLKDRKEIDRTVLAQVANENDDRQIIIRAIAEAVVLINGVFLREDLILGQIAPTRREFTAVRRSLSPSGTWIQLPDGQWVEK